MTEFEVILIDYEVGNSEILYDECAICLENYKLHCFYTLKPCRHIFCINCLSILKERKSKPICPLCRQDIEAFLNVSFQFESS